MKMFSFSTLAGICTAVGLFIYAIISSTENYLMFVSLSSFALVAGSTFAASLISYSSGDIWTAMKALAATFFHAETSQKHLRTQVERFIEWGQIYRSDGITALENSLSEQEKKDDFILHAFDLLGSGHKNHDVSHHTHR